MTATSRIMKFIGSSQGASLTLQSLEFQIFYFVEFAVMADFSTSRDCRGRKVLGRTLKLVEGEAYPQGSRR
jgi:hypothetical protein